MEESFIKSLLKRCVSSLCSVLFAGLGVILLFVFIAIILKRPPESVISTKATLLPNHEWKMGTLSRTAPSIVCIPIVGIIGMDSLTELGIRKTLMDTLDGDISLKQVKAIVLVIDTPGGEVFNSDGIYRALKEYKAKTKVPVYAFVNGMCASGGFYIACATDKIYVTPGSLTGHVGVISGPNFNFSGFMDNLGVKEKTIFAGKNKDELNPFRPWSPDEGADIQNDINALYNTFTTIVSENRKLLTKEVLIEQGAVVQPATAAVTLGYADEIVPSVESLFEKLSKELNIEKTYQVVLLERQTWVDELFSSKCPLISGKIEHRLQFSSFPTELANKPLYLYYPAAK